MERTSELKSNYNVTYWSSPVTGMSLDEAFFNQGVATNRVFQYDPNSTNPVYTGNYLRYRHWFIADGLDEMTPGKGFSVDGPGTSGYPKTVEFSFVGSPNFQDIDADINTWSPYFDDSDITNLLGNPYPCAIDADALIAENDSKFDGTLYLWSNATQYFSGEYSTDDYLTYNLTGSNDSDIPAGYHIASGQGFMILANQGSSSSFSFKNSMQKGGENTSFYKTVSKDSKNDIKNSKDRIWLKLVNDEKIKKEILIGFSSESTDALDFGYDGKLINRDIPLTFYSKLNNEKYAVQGLGSLEKFKSVSIGFDTKSQGNYSIGITKIEGQLNNEKVFLLDRKLRILHDLKAADYYFDESETGEISNRFRLHFRVKKKIKYDPKFIDNIILHQINQQLNISSNNVIMNVKIYDVLGRNFVKRKPRLKELSIDLRSFRKGSILIVNLTLKGGKRVSKKIIVKDVEKLKI